MTASTRKRVIVALVAVVLTLPAEIVLLRALSTPDLKAAITQWVASLDPVQLETAASQVQAYPVAYRRAILRALHSDKRTRVIQRHIQSYIDAHPGLDASSLILLESAKAFVRADLFDLPTAADRASARALGEQAVALLGREDAEYLFVRFGPRDLKLFASAEPVSMRLTNWVRGLFVAMADAEDCNCNTDFGCELNTYCKSGTGCTVDTDWPACGWFWMQDCDGLCRVGMPSGG